MENEDALRILARNWGTRYLVTVARFKGVQHWEAARIGSKATFSIEADTPEDLNEQLGEDNSKW